MTDRTVHGFTADGGQVVRYERAGKWFIEYPDARPRRAVKLDDAVAAAVEGTVIFGRPGGLTFDARARKGLSAMARAGSKST